jgi:hypothetical protein
MSIQASNVFATLMTNLVKPIYLDEAKLTNVIRKQSGVVGGTYEFIRGGYNIARKHSSGDSAVPNNTKFTKIPVVLEDYVSTDYTNIFDGRKMTFDEQSYLSKSIGGALGRMIDQIIINTMNAVIPINAKPTIDVPNMAVIKGDGTFPTNPSAYVAGDRVAFSLASVKKASALMNSLGVPTMGRGFILTPEALEALLNDTTVTSSDFNTVKALVNGELDTYMGFKFFMIGQRAEGGLPASVYTTGPNGGTAFAFHSEAMGIAMGMEPNVEVNYIPQTFSFLVAGKLSANACVIDPNGLIKIIHGTV